MTITKERVSGIHANGLRGGLFPHKMELLVRWYDDKQR
jgi:hypothetical protein